MSNAKRDFGSFHSSNAEELLRQNEQEYKPPVHSTKFNTEFYANLNLVSLFGTKELKNCLYYLNDEFYFLNHGAFGLTFRPTLDYTHKLKCYAESQPLRFYDREIIPILANLIRRFSNLLKCKPTELCLVENCTFAFNSIINSLKLEKNNKVFIFNTTYGVYKKILRDWCHRNEAYLVEETIEFPIIDDQDLEEKAVQKLESVLRKDDSEGEKKIKYIFLDHIPSNHPFIMPIDKIASIERGDRLLIVDAAHTLGSFRRFSFDSYFKNVDLLFTNCHKWFCGPKGTALLYKNEKLDCKNVHIRSAVLSHGFQNGFNSDFIWSGLKDYSNFVGLYSNLELWENCLGGFELAIDYCNKLAHQAAIYLKDLWGTNLLVKDVNLCSSLLCIQLPNNFLSKLIFEVNNLSYDQAELIQNYFYHEHKIEVPIKCIQNKLYVRISAHIYNSMCDYEFLGKVVHEF
jgi:isopenicillin-N epimerase